MISNELGQERTQWQLDSSSAINTDIQADESEWIDVFLSKIVFGIVLRSHKFASHHILLGRIILHHSGITSFIYSSCCFTPTWDSGKWRCIVVSMCKHTQDISAYHMDMDSHQNTFSAWDSSFHFPLTQTQLMRPDIGRNGSCAVGVTTLLLGRCGSFLLMKLLFSQFQVHK